MEWLPKLFKLTVTGNQNEVTFDVTGPVESLTIIPPGTSTYDVEVYDNDGCYLVSENDVSGQIKVPIREVVFGLHTFKISDAGNGIYTFKIRWSKL